MEHQPCTPKTPRCEYWTWQKDHFRPECCTRHLKEILAFTEDLLTRHDIFHFLDFGSLLGAVRDQKLIDWDEDADFSRMSSDLDRVLSLSNETESAGFWLDARQAPHVVRVCRSRTNLAHADLWFHRVSGCFAYSWSTLHENRFRIPIAYLGRMGRVTLEGKLHPAPLPVETFLAEHRYGPDFMTPRRVAAELGWISGEALSPKVQTVLDRLRDVEFRIGRLEAQGKEAAAITPRPWRRVLEQAANAVPRKVLHCHRALWKAKHRATGERDGVLLEAQYSLYRRQTVLRLMESRQAVNPAGESSS
jgi:hypothetical protein